MVVYRCMLNSLKHLLRQIGYLLLLVYFLPAIAFGSVHGLLAGCDIDCTMCDRHEPAGESSVYMSCCSERGESSPYSKHSQEPSGPVKDCCTKKLCGDCFAEQDSIFFSRTLDHHRFASFPSQIILADVPILPGDHFLQYRSQPGILPRQSVALHMVNCVYRI